MSGAVENQGMESRANAIAVAIVGSVIALGVIGIDSCRRALAQPPLNEQFVRGWSESTHLGIARALVQSKIAGCGQLWHRRHREDPARHLVACTADGDTLRFYSVDTARGTARAEELAEHLGPRLP